MASRRRAASAEQDDLFNVAVSLKGGALGSAV
jgi:hypothetical protein